MCELQKPTEMSDATKYSFSKIMERGDVLTYYTCPAKSSNSKDHKAILGYYDKVLTQEKKDKKWRWVFDCDGFDERHACQTSLAYGIIKLINEKHGESLVEIKIMNYTWHVQAMINVLWPFLGKKMRSIIVIDKETKNKKKKYIF
jgi:hypothetical protein